MQKKNYLTYIHALRGLAIIMIVAVHTRGYSENWLNHENGFHFLQTLLDNSTFIFLFIGGFLFKHIYVNTFNYKKYLVKKFQYVFLPYLIMSIPGITIRIVTGYIPDAMDNSFLSWPVLLKILYFFTTGSHLVPLWFMPMIFMFYLVSPLIVKLDNKVFYTYFLPVILFLNLFTFRPMYNADPFLAFIHFLPVYLFGMWACSEQEKLTGKGWSLAIPMLAMYLILMVLEYYNLIDVNREVRFETIFREGRLFFNVVQLKMAFLSIVLLLLFYKIRHFNFKFLSLMGNYSFGIYFIHHYFVAITNIGYKKAGLAYTFNAGTYLLFTAVVLFLSSLTVFFLQKIFKKKSRYIIGS